jgi:hypothetical protein
MAEQIEEKEARLFALIAERDEARARMEALTQERDSLPRNDKQGAHKLLIEIEALRKKAAAYKVPIIQAREAVDRVERHGLWETAVLTLWGAEGLAACRAQMRQEKMNRGTAAALQETSHG